MKKADDFITNIIGDLTPTGKFWAKLGLCVLFVAAAMSFDFGFSVSWKHGVFLALLSFVTAFGPEVAYKMWEEGRKPTATILAIICVPLFAIEFYTHAGYTAGLRGHNIAETKVQNTKYDGAQEGVKEAKANLVIFTKQLNTLMEQNAWAATVKAEGLRTQAAQLEQNIASETKLGGCGRKCRGLQDDLTKVRNQIAVAEQRSDIEKQIAATKRIIDGAREKADTVEYKSSAVVHQNEFLANALALVGQGKLEPTAFLSASAQQSVNLAMAMVGTGLPGLAIFISGLFRRRKEDGYTARPTSTDVQPRTPTYSAPAPKGMHPDMAAIMGMLKGSNLNATSNTIGRAAGLA